MGRLARVPVPDSVNESVWQMFLPSVHSTAGAPATFHFGRAFFSGPPWPSFSLHVRPGAK
jgi:hypothetical protein